MIYNEFDAQRVRVDHNDDGTIHLHVTDERYNESSLVTLNKRQAQMIASALCKARPFDMQWVPND